ncbi:MAG: serine hydrolase [Reyranella sp.]|nr:serine hydrolase [Reyranella sp.]
MIRRALLLLALLFAVPAAAQPSTGPCGKAEAIGDGWTVAAPEEVGLDGTKLCGLEAFLKQWPTANIHAVVVARHGKLVAEHYLSGRDVRFAGEGLGLVHFTPTTKHDVRSISKSVTSLLVGIALGDGKFPPLDSAVIDSFPEYASLRTPENARITFRDLLTMAPGWKWNESADWLSVDNTERPMFEADDPYRYIWERPVVVTPGTLFNYSGGATTLLGGVVARTTGRRIDDYAREKLFGPLSITDFEWLDFAKAKEIAAFGGLRLRPRDLAKIGQLMVSGGMWNGQRVLPEGWVAESTKPRLNTEGLLFYGYQWWLGRSLYRGRSVDWIGGVGLGGQRLFVLPKLDLVVAINSAHYSGPLQGIIPYAILNRFVLPAIKD